jgi:hypothetical protein
MITHFRNGKGRTACRLLSDFVTVTSSWVKVTCTDCLNSYEGPDK